MKGEEQNLIYNLAVIGLALIAFSFWIAKNNKSHELFASFAAKHNLNIMKDSGWFFRPATPRLKGKINHLEVDVISQKIRGKWRKRYEYFTVLRVHSRTADNFIFSVGLANSATKLLSGIISIDVQTGFGEFDTTYHLTTNNEARILKLFDHHLCDDFVSNPEAFESSGLKYSSGLLEYKWDFIVTDQGHMDRLGEIMLFMVHVVEQIEKSPKGVVA